MLTPAKCRAGRALLGMTQQELAKKASVCLGTVHKFESERDTISYHLRNAIKGSLEECGVAFTARGVELL